MKHTLRKTGFSVIGLSLAAILLFVAVNAFAASGITPEKVSAGAFFKPDYSYYDKSIPLEEHAVILIPRFSIWINSIDGKLPNTMLKTLGCGAVIPIPAGHHEMAVSTTASNISSRGAEGNVRRKELSLDFEAGTYYVLTYDRISFNDAKTADFILDKLSNFQEVMVGKSTGSTTPSPIPPQNVSEGIKACLAKKPPK